jgi:hypothetical protein
MAEHSHADARHEPDAEELDELERHIEHARNDADEAIHGVFYEGEHPLFADSGETPEEDDQTITP